MFTETYYRLLVDRAARTDRYLSLVADTALAFSELEGYPLHVYKFIFLQFVPESSYLQDPTLQDSVNYGACRGAGCDRQWG